MGRKAGSRAKAIAKGLATYSGKPCVDCGRHVRRTRDCACVHCLDMDEGRTNTQAARTWPHYKAQRAAYERYRRAIRKARTNPLSIYLGSLQVIEINQPRKDKTMVTACPHKATAKKAGRKTYDAPYICSECDTTRRYTHSGNCVECSRRAAKAYRAKPAAQAANRERQARFRARQLAKKTGLLDDI